VNNQRSVVRSIVVTFTDNATILATQLSDAFRVTRLATSKSPGPVGNVGLSVLPVGNTATITFKDAAFAPTAQGKSLIDGQYSLTIVGSKLANDGGFFDGNGDGIGGDDNVSSFFRLYGDSNGDGVVTAPDFAKFRMSFFPNFNTIFDYNGDGVVGLPELAQFRAHFSPFAP
jgi:hypothetical protein